MRLHWRGLPVEGIGAERLTDNGEGGAAALGSGDQVGDRLRRRREGSGRRGAENIPVKVANILPGIAPTSP